MTFVLIAGARPNFVKIAPIFRELERREAKGSTLVHTGQHYDHELSGVFFEQLEIPAPDIHLEVGSGSHGEQTGKVMIALENYLRNRPLPDAVVVVGDVNSTVAGALVASKLGIRTVHVEAGLRSFDRTMPEEINRVVTDAISDLLLVSEPAGLENLRREGVPSEKVRYVGNVMIDTLIEQLPHARALDMPRTLGLVDQAYALVTLHRPANVDSPSRLEALVNFLVRLARKLPVVFPLHPRTRAQLERAGLMELLVGDKAIHVCRPLAYREFLGATDGARIVVTDSGGVQEETSFLGIACITLRSNTERPVTVTQGTNCVVGDDLELALQTCERQLAALPRTSVKIEGWDGRAAVRIVDALLGPS